MEIFYGALISNAGRLTGRLLACRRWRARPVRAVCGCGPGRAFHDPETGT